MKTIIGIILGLVAYAGWTLSEPAEGESGELPARFERLKLELARASARGKLAGQARQAAMEREFQNVFRDRNSPSG